MFNELSLLFKKLIIPLLLISKLNPVYIYFNYLAAVILFALSSGLTSIPIFLAARNTG